MIKQTLVHEEISNLTSDDAVVIWGGSNDVDKNETSCGLKHLQNFINHRNNTNILALAARHRHDLQDTSRINKKAQGKGQCDNKISTFTGMILLNMGCT